MDKNKCHNAAERFVATGDGVQFVRPEKKEAEQKRRSGFDAPAYGMVVPEGARLVELESGNFKLIMPEEDDKL